MAQPSTKHFHNSIQVDDQLLMEFNEKAKSQEQRVFEVFLEHKVAFAWWQVAAYLPDMNECSLKRCLSNLAKAGKLVKDTSKANMVMGLSGKPCHTYILINKN